MLKLAIDNQISKDTVEKLSKHYEVVVTAGNLADEIWINDGLDLGANVFISPDLDVPNFLDRLGADYAIWIEVPQGMKSHKQFDFLMKKLKNVNPSVI